MDHFLAVAAQFYKTFENDKSKTNLAEQEIL